MAESTMQGAKLQSDLQRSAAELSGLRTELLQVQVRSGIIAEKIKDAEQDLECSICMERNATVVFNPCGHCACCHLDCGTARAIVCSFCNQTVQSRTRIFGMFDFSAAVSGEELGAITSSLGVTARHRCCIEQCGARACECDRSHWC